MKSKHRDIRSVFVISGIFFASILLSGCETIVRTTINTANRNFEAEEATRNREIWDQSVARYKAMAEAGHPGGLYYMAVVHAVTHEREPDGDVLTVKKLYEEAIEKGSNDARVALGRMLIWGHSHPLNLNTTFPQELRDPPKGIELLKTAAKQSCFYVEPLIGIGRCRERQASTPAQLERLYYSGLSYQYDDDEKLKACGKEDGACRIKALIYKPVVVKDAEQAAYWAKEYYRCKPIIQEFNKKNGCND